MFWEVQLGFSEKIIVSNNILERSSEFCSKTFSQQSMKFMVALSETNSSVVEFYGNG